MTRPAADPPGLSAFSEDPFYIVPAPLALAVGEVPACHQWDGFRMEVTASGGAPPYAFDAFGLPAGLTIE